MQISRLNPFYAKFQFSYNHSMQTTIKIHDKLTYQVAGQPLEFAVSLPAENVSVRQLIEARVRQEVEAFNAEQSTYFNGLVQPSDTEQTLNGYHMKQKRPIDWQGQCRKALEAFERNGFILLVDERQAASLDEMIVVTPQTQVTFLRLVPLVGG